MVWSLTVKYSKRLVTSAGKRSMQFRVSLCAYNKHWQRSHAKWPVISLLPLSKYNCYCCLRSIFSLGKKMNANTRYLSVLVCIPWKKKKQWGKEINPCSQGKNQKFRKMMTKVFPRFHAKHNTKEERRESGFLFYFIFWNIVALKRNISNPQQEHQKEKPVRSDAKGTHMRPFISQTELFAINDRKLQRSTRRFRRFL